MQIRFYANLRTLTNRSILNITDPEICTIHQLIDYLVIIYPKTASLLKNKQGELPRDVPIFINGRNPRLQDTGLNRMLETEDVISIFSPIASGRMNVEVMRAAMPSESEKMV